MPENQPIPERDENEASVVEAIGRVEIALDRLTRDEYRDKKKNPDSIIAVRRGDLEIVFGYAVNARAAEIVSELTKINWPVSQELREQMAEGYRESAESDLAFAEGRPAPFHSHLNEDDIAVMREDSDPEIDMDRRGEV